MMMSFCKKSVHSLLGFTPPWKSPHFNNALPNSDDGLPNIGLGLISADLIKSGSPNVLASASVKSFSPPKKDPSGIGFIDYIGGGVDGLMSCTESLGFESSDERLVNDFNQMEDTVGLDCGGDRRIKDRRRKAVVRKFPPPLSSLNQHGQPKFYLRPVRKEGRLELMEVSIERQEILRASRQDGRLRLHFIGYEDDQAGEDTAAVEEEEEVTVEEQAEEEEIGNFVKEEGIRVNNIPVSGRCNRRERRHHLDVWRRHCVTTN